MLCITLQKSDTQYGHEYVDTPFQNYWCYDWIDLIVRDYKTFGDFLVKAGKTLAGKL